MSDPGFVYVRTTAASRKKAAPELRWVHRLQVVGSTGRKLVYGPTYVRGAKAARERRAR